MAENPLYLKIYPFRTGSGDCECPFCHKEDEIDEGNIIQYEDYVEYPMVWCEYCGGYGVLDRNTFYSYLKYVGETKDEFEDVKFSDDIKHLLESVDDRDKNDFAVEIPMLWIRRVADVNMCRYVSEVVLSSEQMTQFLNEECTKKYKYISNEKFCQEMKLKELEEYDQPPQETVMNISLPVESYNLQNPKIPYHPNVDLCHDGPDIYLEIVTLDGKNKVISFSGD